MQSNDNPATDIYMTLEAWKGLIPIVKKTIGPADARDHCILPEVADEDEEARRIGLIKSNNPEARRAYIAP